MKVRRVFIDTSVKFLAFFAVPLSLVKSWALLPLVLIRFGSRRLESVGWVELFYLFLVIICFLGNLVVGREHNFNTSTPMTAQIITCGLMFFWLFVVHSSNASNLAALILFYLISVNFATFFLIGFTFTNDPAVLFSRRFLSPMPDLDGGFIATPGFGNSSGILLVASIGFLKKKYQYFALLSAIMISLMLQNRTLMIICIVAAGFVLTTNREKLSAFTIGFCALAIAVSLLPKDFTFGTFDLLKARLVEEGASSDRWLLYSVVIDDILAGENLLGGLDPNVYAGYTFYFHNGVFDSYKTFGIAGFLFSVLIIVSLSYALIRSFSPYKALVWFVGVSVFLTSVVFEGTKFEAYVLFLLFALLFRQRLIAKV